jgi:hypothetical protein
VNPDMASALIAGLFVVIASGIGTFFGWHLHAAHLRDVGRRMADEAEEYARRVAGHMAETAGRVEPDARVGLSRIRARLRRRGEGR